MPQSQSSQSDENPTAGVFRSTAANTAAALAGLTTAIVLARYYGVTTVGVYFFFLIIGQSVARIPAGVGGAIRRQMRLADVDTSDYFGASLLFSVGIVFFATIAALATIALYDGAYSSTFGLTTLTAVGTITVTGGLSVYHLIHSGYTATKDSSWNKTLRYTSIAGAHIGLAYAGFPVGYFLAAYGGLSFFWGVIMIPFASGVGTPGIPEFSGIIKTSYLTVPSSIASNFHHKADVIIIGVLVGINSVGLYESSLQLVIPVMLAASTISSLMSSRLRGESSGYRAAELIRSAVTYSAILAFPILAIFMAMSHESLWYIFGPDFLDAWLLLILLSITQLLASLRTPFNLALRATHQNKSVLGIRFGAFLANIPLSIYLVLSMGVLGAVIATLIVELLTLVAYYALVRRTISQTIRFEEIIKQAASAGISFAVAYGFVWSGVVTSLPRLISVGALSLGVFFIAYISLSRRARRIIIVNFFQ